jgi:hypothetical protein
MATKEGTLKWFNEVTGSGWGGRGRRQAVYLVRSTVLALAIIVVALIMMRLF